MLKSIRLLSFAGMLGLYLTTGGNLSAATGHRTDVCTEACSVDADCATECHIEYPDGPPFDTDCGSFTEGQCGDTCAVICSPIESGETECNGPGGDPTTCEDYGIYLHCGDAFCATGYGETCGNCPGDCYCPTPIATVIIDPDDPEDLCDSQASAGISTDCPDYLEGGTGMSCGQKALVLEDLLKKIRLLQAWMDYYIALAAQQSTNAYDTLIAQLNSLAMAAGSEYLSLHWTTCFPAG